EMGGCRIGCLLKLTLYRLPRSIKMLFPQVHFHELIDWPQAIWRELGGFFKSLASFAISLCLTQSQAKRHLRLGVEGRKPCLLANDHGGIVEAIKRPVCSGQEQCRSEERRVGKEWR